jgi:hypothetical protein
VSLAQVNTVWPDWLRLAKAFTDSYEVDAARALGAFGSLADPDQVDAAVLGSLECRAPASRRSVAGSSASVASRT